MKRMRDLVPCLVLLGLLFTGCTAITPTPDMAATPTIASASDPADVPQAVLAVRDAFAQSLNLASSEVPIVSFQSVEWPDSCLGAAAADEMCAMMITPGYEIVVENQGVQQVLHTDADGAAWRIAQP